MGTTVPQSLHLIFFPACSSVALYCLPHPEHGNVMVILIPPRTCCLMMGNRGRELTNSHLKSSSFQWRGSDRLAKTSWRNFLASGRRKPGVSRPVGLTKGVGSRFWS
jgi:hypothetical protein